MVQRTDMETPQRKPWEFSRAWKSTPIFYWKELYWYSNLIAKEAGKCSLVMCQEEVKVYLRNTLGISTISL